MNKNTPPIAFLKEKGLFIFFVVLTLFPTVRVFVLGSDPADSALELLLAALPELLLVVLCGIYFLHYVQHQKPTFHVLDYMMIAYILYNLLAGFMLANDFSASMYGVRMTYLPMIFYFLVSFSNFSKERIEKFLYRIFQLCFEIAVIGLIIYFFFPKVQTYFSQLISDKGEAEYFIIRMTSVFWTPVLFGVLMTAGVLFWQYKYLQEQRKVYLLYIAILFISVCLSVSRGPIISAIFGVVLMAILRIDWKNNVRVFGLTLGCFLIVSFYINNPLKFSKWILFSTQETVQLKEGNTRADLAKNTYQLIADNPMGIGLGKAGHVAVQRFDPARKDVSFTTTDGWYLKLLVETGYIGLLFYILILITFIIYCLKYMRTHRFDWMWFIFVFGAVVSLQNVVSNVLDFYLFAYLYWFILGLCVYILKKEKHAAS